jgi:hypothetical protein
MTWIVIFLENSLPMLFDGPGHREKLDVLIYSEANSTYGLKEDAVKYNYSANGNHISI